MDSLIVLVGGAMAIMVIYVSARLGGPLDKSQKKTMKEVVVICLLAIVTISVLPAFRDPGSMLWNADVVLQEKALPIFCVFGIWVGLAFVITMVTVSTAGYLSLNLIGYLLCLIACRLSGDENSST